MDVAILKYCFRTITTDWAKMTDFDDVIDDLGLCGRFQVCNGVYFYLNL